MTARCSLIKHLFSKTGNVILHQEIIEVLICFGFHLAACLYKKMIQEEAYRTYAVHEDKVYQKPLHSWNKYINSHTLKLPPIHTFKSLKRRQVYAIWNSVQ